MPCPLFWDHQLKEGTGRNRSDERQEKGPVRIVGHCLYLHLPKNYVLKATLSGFCCLG